MTDDINRTYTVLVNDEEQHALFPAELPLPDGWRAVGFSGTEDACIGYVDKHWVDMRPLSLRTAVRQDVG